MDLDNFNNDFYIRHAQLLCSSYTRWTHQSLLSEYCNPDKLILALYKAPFAIVSHGIEEDPVFNFGNKTALDLFELEWDQFIQLPSRNSVEMTNRKEREELMHRVSNDGHIIDYTGVRISSTGKRFIIEGATIWNIVDGNDDYHGQAAMFTHWAAKN